MGASHSREGDLESSDSDSETESQDSPAVQATPQQQQFQDATDTIDIEKKLSALSIDGNGKSVVPDLKSSVGAGATRVKLYRHIGGNSATAKWAVADKLVLCRFVREGSEDEDYAYYDSDAEDDGDDDDDYEEGLSKNKGFRTWLLQVGDKVRARVDERLQLRAFDEQLRVDFVNRGVWAIKFLNPNDFKAFLHQLQNCIFENTYLMEASEANKIKVFGKDFLGWADPNAADESIWEAAEENLDSATPKTEDDDSVMEEYEEDIAESGGIQSLAMGALDYSFLVSGRGVEAVKNMQNGIQGKGVSVPFEHSGLIGVTSTPKKAMLIRAETNMLLMSPAKEGRPHSTGLHQLDIETGKIVTEWKFEKDGTPITMRDVTNDNKGSQLDPSASTFLGLDDNRLCRWDMRLKHGVAQQIAGDEEDGPVLTWQQGHQFSKGTNFQCFASAGDGCVVVGSADGKIRLYGKTSMRMAKTAFPGLGSPITHVDVTYDGKWILGTTDTYLILISTLFTDKDGKLKTGFAGRMGNKIAAPRLLKLTPVDSHHAGPTHNFQGGKFSWVTESGKQEHHLVATVGNFTVIWNFKQVKNSNHECYRNQDGLKSCYCYKIVPKDESIVDSSFMHDKFAITDNPEAPLVVVTPKNVSSFSIAPGR